MGSPGGAAGGASPDAALRSELEALRKERDRLQDALERAMRSVVLFRGYLHQHQPEYESIGLLQAEWEMRWLTLGSGGLLKIFEGDRDEGQEPGAMIYIADCILEVEPPGVDRPFSMRILERAPPAGGGFLLVPTASVSSSSSAAPTNELLLLSADSAASLMQWADAFSRAGLKVVWPPGGLGRGRGGNGTGGGGLAAARTNSAPLLSPGAIAAAAAANAAPASAPGARPSGGGGLLRQLSALALPPLLDDKAAAAAADSGDESADSLALPPRLATPPRRGVPPPPPRPAAAEGQRLASERPARRGALSSIRLPSARWLRQPSREDFAAFLDPLTPLQQARISEGGPEGGAQQPGRLQQQEARRQAFGRSKSASNVKWAAGGADADAPRPPSRPPSGGDGGGGGGGGGADASPFAGPPPPAAVAAAAAAADPQAQQRQGSGAAAGGRRASRVMFGSTAVHTAFHESLLTHPSTYSQTHTGLVTLALVVLGTVHVRALLENLLEYRLRLTLLNREVWSALYNIAGDNAACIAAVPGLLAFAAASLAVERLALALLRREQAEDDALRKKRDTATSPDDRQWRAYRRARASRHESLVVPLAIANCVLSLLLPSVMVFRLEAHPFPALLLTVGALVMQMKLMSYHHHCWHLRTIRRRHGPGARAPGERGGGGGDDVEAPWCVLAYPENLTACNMLFFLAVPTLTYQVNYPLLPQRRPRLLLHWIIVLLALTSLELLLIDQLLVPAMLSGLRPLAELDWPSFCERVLGLALPNLYVWLLGFVILFHVWLNIMGELTGFADRCFYKAWWNASSLDQFWRLWNMPVHTFLMRTIYFPLIRMRVNKWWALVVVFFWSALMHEVAVGIPFRILRGWAFWAMFGQIPLITLTAYIRQRLKNDSLGNAIFWVSFCILGQPLCIMLYAHEYLKREEAARLARGGF